MTPEPVAVALDVYHPAMVKQPVEDGCGDDLSHVCVMMASKPKKKEAAMTDFTITEDFPRSEIEFDARFSDPDACYQYLFQL
ncbi:hypothetical protein DSCOOX_13210 [Desulfosarcina ovata subsp. ovata]|uniref:Uncharacterized protein n=1 Tax=Desulfosarcina ovata subsp. ovata TaxID=2752305 RepID=A0A5K8A6P3_9BACT|nr:hypothetical protein DSCOOX_13210 [Desulfosarcina ovata subsp. ovata]